MQNCKRPCSPADMDEIGRCKCDRETELVPRVQLFAVIGKMRKVRAELRRMQIDFLDLHSMNFVPFADGLCSLDAAISKIENFAMPQKKQTMDKVNVSLSIQQLEVIANLVYRCNESKQLRNAVFYDLKIQSDKPFILSVLSNKLNVLLAESKQEQF